MVEFFLSPDYNIIRSPKSYNSQIGVPLICYCNQRATQSGILSRNFNGFRNGKIRAIIKPTIGILTNIGTAHDEGFANSQEKKEKLKLLNTFRF
jgi:alanine racemase